MGKKIIILLIFIFSLTGCGESKIEQVKGKYLNSCSNHNVGELLDNLYDEVVWSEEKGKVVATGLVYGFETTQETVFEFSLNGKNLIVNKVAKKQDDGERIYEKADYEDLVDKLCEVSDIAAKGSLKAKAKVKVLYNEEAFVVEGAPEEIDITIYGDDVDIYSTLENNDYEVFLDLRNLKASDKKQKVYIQTSFDSKKVVIKPSENFVEVLISKKTSAVFNLEYEIINKDKLKDKQVKNIVCNQKEIICKGSQKDLSKIDIVKATFDVSDSKFLERGTITADSKYIRAYDKKGNALENIEIVPRVVEANFEIDDK